MSDDYTPATEEVSAEQKWIARILDDSDPEMGGVVSDEGHESWEWYLPQVDALLRSDWLASHDAQVKAEALREAETEWEYRWGASINGAWPSDQGSEQHVRRLVESDTWPHNVVMRRRQYAPGPWEPVEAARIEEEGK